MNLQYGSSDSIVAFGTMLESMDADPAVASIFVFAADGNAWTPEGIDGILKAVHKPVFGGIFPQLLYKEQRLEVGVIVLGLPCRAKILSIDQLSKLESNRQNLFEESNIVAKVGGTMIAMVDGLSQGISSLIAALYDNYGLTINYIGGGCGSLSLIQKPCVITPDGLKADVALLAYLDMPSGIGIAHGWKPVSVAYRVTESIGNSIVSLDWRPAFEVYRSLVESHSHLSFAGNDFFSISKSYPLGIAKLGSEVVVRDPIKVQDGKLICVGEVDTGSFVYILHGDRDSLIDAATEARTHAQTMQAPAICAIEILIDCISRVLFLDTDFPKELEAAHVVGLPQIGALTLGEIANRGQEYLEFHNKTVVVALL